MSLISDQYARLSLHLQAAFGLRREESIKFSPCYAMQSDHIKLKSSWTKGGRARTVPIRNDEQRQLLAEIKALVKGGSLIPAQLNYVQQLNRYQRQLRNIGMSKLHGLRHAYAQQRYLELTGWQAPVAGGPTSKELKPEQLAPDYEARAIVSNELGMLGSRLQQCISVDEINRCNRRFVTAARTRSRCTSLSRYGLQPLQCGSPPLSHQHSHRPARHCLRPT